jgi:Fanconi anemia group M protein
MLTAVFSLQHALELLETQGINNLNNYFIKLKKKKTKASQGLFKNDDFNQAVKLTHKAHKDQLEHPKMKKLIKILKKELKKNQQIIVFSQYRDTVNDIHQKCEENDIKSVKFFGQAAREKEKGLTQKEQKKIIKNFRKGKYQVLISTSVAEEGIDVPSVDLVILYEPVPSEIRMIQRRGRTGRKTEGQMIVLITKGTRDESYYYSSVRKEKKMKSQLTKGYDQIEPLIKQDEQSPKIPLKKDKQPVVYVDHRESKSGVVRELSNLGVNIKTSTLTVADYQLSTDVAVERKSARDFAGSIIDKRIYKQARELVLNFKKPLLIVEGENIYSGGLHPNAIRGALASLAVDFEIPIIPTRSPEDTAAMIYRLAVREQEKTIKEISLRTERKPLSLQEHQIFIIESLPNVGPVTARKLLEKFKTVKNVILASEEELTEVEGIGIIIAQKIREVITSRFKTGAINGKTAPDKELTLSDDYFHDDVK